MLVWTQSIPGIEERPALDLWNYIMGADKRGKIVLALFPLFLLVCVALSSVVPLKLISMPVVIFFLGVTLSSKLLNVKIKDFTFDLEPAAFLAGLIVVGPVWSVVNSFIGVLFYEYFVTRTLLEGKKICMNLFNVECSVVSAGASALVYAALLPAAGHPGNFLFAFLRLCAAAFVLISTNQLMVSFYFAVLDGVTFQEVLRSGLTYGNVMFATLANLTFITLTPLGFLFAILFERFPIFILALIPLLALLYCVPNLIFEIKQEVGAALEMMEEVLNARCEAGPRASRISHYARVIAEEMSLSPEEVDACSQAARIHDIGSIIVRDEVLKKDGELSREEYEHIQQHVRIIPTLFPKLDHFGKILKVAMLHHERYDGSGYPYGLRGHDIPVEARVVAVADAWDAMTRRRSYKDTYTDGQALQILLDGAGLQWDPRVVHALLKGYQEGLLTGGETKAA